MDRESIPHTKRIRYFEEGAPITDTNGLSGSPVLLKINNNDEFALVGMVLNGLFPIGHFATVEWITKAVRKIKVTPPRDRGD
jgi:hypothetical protein